MQADLVFRKGTVVDGTGSKPYIGDVAIKDGQIIAVGPDLSNVAGAREVDATGKHIMPGWTDVHTHLDTQCMWDPLLSPSGTSGVTTCLMGSCGVGAAPTRKEGRDFMINTLSFVEDIPGESIREGVKWSVNGKDWESFAEYLDCLDTLNLVCDIGTMVPHSCVRGYVLGPERANLSDKPGGPWKSPLSRQEKEAIAACVKESVAAGALGMSITRWWEHRDANGVLCAGTLADADELILCAKATAEAGGCMFQMHNDFKSYDDIPEEMMDPELRKQHTKREWAWMKFITKEYGLKLNWLGGGGGIEFLDKFADRGMNMFHQCLVRPQSLIMTWASRMHPFTVSRTFRKIKQLPSSEWYAELSKPSVRAEIIAALDSRVRANRKGDPVAVMWRLDSDWWEKLYPMDGTFDYEPGPEKCVKALAHSSGRSVYEVAYDAMLAHGGKGVMWTAQDPNVKNQYEGIRKALLHPRCVPGISDSGAHMQIFQDGISPTSMISFWARDRVRGEKLPLELCVQKQARDTAYLYGLTDRGTLEPGKKADLNMVDMEKLRIHQPEIVNDLPTGNFRWTQQVTGYDMTVVSGVVTFEMGRHTGAFPGRLVRNNGQPLPEDVVLPDVPSEFIGYRRAGEAGQAATDEAAVLESALKNAAGASRISTISLSMEKEESTKDDAPASKL